MLIYIYFALSLFFLINHIMYLIASFLSPFSFLVLGAGCRRQRLIRCVSKYFVSGNWIIVSITFSSCNNKSVWLHHSRYFTDRCVLPSRKMLNYIIWYVLSLPWQYSRYTMCQNWLKSWSTWTLIAYSHPHSLHYQNMTRVLTCKIFYNIHIIL